MRFLAIPNSNDEFVFDLVEAKSPTDRHSRDLVWASVPIEMLLSDATCYNQLRLGRTVELEITARLESLTEGATDEPQSIPSDESPTKPR